MQADPPVGVEPRLMAAQWMVADGRVDEAAPLLDELGEELPGEPEVAQWKDVLDRHRTDATGASEPAVLTGPPRPLREVIDALFGGDPYGYEIQERFLESFQGVVVEGTGVLERLSTYSRDYDFSGGPGVKAVASIGTVRPPIGTFRMCWAGSRAPPGSSRVSYARSGTIDANRSGPGPHHPTRSMTRSDRSWEKMQTAREL